MSIQTSTSSTGRRTEMIQKQTFNIQRQITNEIRIIFKEIIIITSPLRPCFLYPAKYWSMACIKVKNKDSFKYI